MSRKIGEAGARGESVRSDCWIAVELKAEGGIELSVESLVESMFGDAIRALIHDGLRHLGLEHAAVTVEDQGAVDFVIMARLEAAVRRAGACVDKPWLPPRSPKCTAPTTADRFRRSRLYIPGDTPRFFLNAGLHKPDGIIFDLEDSVAPAQKDTARLLVRNALCAVDTYGAERMVRINQLPLGLEDLAAIVPHNVHVVLVPKVEAAEQLWQVAEQIATLRTQHDVKEPVYLMPIIESALGAIKAYEIASAHESIVALALGLEDYTADIGTERTLEGKESFWLRSVVVNAARAAGVQPIDTVFSDVGDMAGLQASVLEAKSLGFDGKGCIHPRQIPVIHEAFAPADAEIKKATKIVEAFERAEAAGLGVVSLGSKMIDPPVVKRALRTVNLAIATGKLSAGWRAGGANA